MQVCKPDSVSCYPDNSVNRILIIYLVPGSPPASIDLPILLPASAESDEQPSSPENRRKQDLFDLSTHKVCHAPVVTNEAVSSYLTISPLSR